MINLMQNIPGTFIRRLPGAFSRNVLEEHVRELVCTGFKKIRWQQPNEVIYCKIHNGILKECRAINFLKGTNIKNLEMNFGKLVVVRKIFQQCIRNTKAKRKELENNVKLNTKGELEDKDYRKLDGVFKKLDRLLKKYSPLIKAIQVRDPFSLNSSGFTLDVLPANPKYHNDLKTYFSFIETIFETRHLLADRPGRPLGPNTKTQELHTLAKNEYRRRYRINRYESHAAICEEVHALLIKSNYSITGKTLQTILRPLRNQLKQSRKKRWS